MTKVMLITVLQSSYTFSIELCRLNRRSQNKKRKDNKVCVANLFGNRNVRSLGRSEFESLF
jgi:hypothetical protein